MAWGCSRMDPGHEAPITFKTITPKESNIVLQANGSAQLPFAVKDALYEFNYDVNSPDCQVSLRLTGGRPATYYAITAIKKIDADGNYEATITDKGEELLYKEKVSLVLSLSEKTKIASSPFIVISESADKGEIVLRTGLPIVSITTKENAEITSKEDYVDATMEIDGINLFDDFEIAPCQIRGRGNSTWMWPKKPYLVKLDKKASVLGMPKHKRWILLANFMDRTMMRNIVAYKVASLTSLAWTPRSVSVELVLNGTYVGNYLLIEQIRVDEDRVNIAEMAPEDVTSESITGGYLLEIDYHNDNEIQWLSPYGRCAKYATGIPFAVKYPDEEDIVQPQVEWIRNYVDEAAKTLYSTNFADVQNGYRKYLDATSFADYWLVFELMGNHELSNPASIYMHKDRGGKLVAGPVWDFDWGSLSYDTSPIAKHNLINYGAIWYAQLMKDPTFKKLVKDRWDALKPLFQTIPAYIDQQEQLLSASALVNFILWDPAQDASLHNGVIINGDEEMNFHDAVARLKEIYLQRITVMDRIIAEW